MNILFINAGRRCELIQAFKNALNSGPGGNIYATDIMETAPALSLVDDYRIMPHSSNDDFPDRFCAYCQEMGVDLVIPTIDPDLVNLSKWRSVIKETCPEMKILLPPETCISLCNDKRLSKKQFASAGASVPADISPDDDNLEFPLFLKPANGSASKGIHKISSRQELDYLYPLARNPVLEPYIEGPEITVDVLCDLNGTPLTAIPRHRISVRGGEVSKGIIKRNDDLENLAMKMARAFDCTGPVTVQFRNPQPGIFYAMEINARMGGGLPLTIAAGADWPGWIIDLCLGRKPNTNVAVEDELLMSRYDSSVFISTTKPSASTPPDLCGVTSVIFDLDDTLYKEKNFVIEGFRAVALAVYGDHGVDVMPHLVAGFEQGIRNDAFGRCMRNLGLDTDESYLKSLVEVYRSSQKSLRPFLDIVEIERLKASGVAIGLVTDGWLAVQQAKVEALGIAHLFDSIVYTDGLGGRDFWKPSPAGLLKCLQELGVEPKTAVYVADNPHKDFQAAKAAGMRSIRLARPGCEHASKRDLLDAVPDATITGLHELGPLLQG